MIPTYVYALAVRAFQRRTDPSVAAVLGRLRQQPANEVDLGALLADDPVAQASLAPLVEYTPSHWLIEAELTEVNARRRAFNPRHGVTQAGEPYDRAFDSGLVGLCFSGGGIRSATFNLGILQGLAERDLLRRFDYLSTVSGGGYIHQWFAAWIRRTPRHPGDSDAVAGIKAFAAVNDALAPAPGRSGAVNPPQIHWLRRYSNYLTPMRGVFTADTWVGVATWFRNTLLNQVALISAMFFVLLLPQMLALMPTAPRLPAAMPQPPSLIAIVALVPFALVIVATVLVGRNLAKKTADQRSLDEGEVQRGIVIPMLTWSVLLTMVQRILALTSPIMVLPVFAVASLVAAVVAFGGGAVGSYIATHHGDWDRWRTAREHGRTRFLLVRLTVAIVGVVFVATVAGAVAATWSAYVPAALVPLLSRWLDAAVDPWRVALVLAPPLYLLAPILGLVALVGLLGRTFPNARREWLARLTGWGAMYALGWIVIVGAALFGRSIVSAVAHKAPTALSWSALLTWIGVSLGGVLSGRSSATTPETPNGSDPKRGWFSWDTLATIAPYVFIAGLLLLIGFLAEHALEFADARGGWTLTALLVLLPAVAVITAWRVDINDFSMHAFYRDRLARCYLGASNPDRSPDPFTGFDERDASEDTRLAQFRPSQGYFGPYPIFCTALNLIVGSDLAWQERKAASFMFSPLLSGYDLPASTVRNGRPWMRYNGFARTDTYAYPPSGIHITTAAAISGAAVSPNWGYHTNPATAFLMTLFNVRLGWWLLNPRRVDEHGAVRGDAEKHPSPTPHFALQQLASELFSQIDSTSKYVYLTDGGHFDNMGLYELVRRQCRYIVICDGEEDGEQTFDGLAMAIRKCRTDFGVEVTLDVRSVRTATDSPYASRHVVAGTIRYPGSWEDKPKDGIVLYVKSSLTADEPADILSYKRSHPHFPHDSTLNQWFTESQFESYRRLGLHVMHTVLAPVANLPGASTSTPTYFEMLSNVWYPPTAEMERYQSAHAARYLSLIEELRTDGQLAGLLPMLLDPAAAPPLLEWKASAQDRDYALTFVIELLEFAWTVYDDLGLVHPANVRHPHTVGWIEIFKRWWNVDVVHEAWKRYGGQYSREFQLFVADYVAG